MRAFTLGHDNADAGGDPRREARITAGHPRTGCRQNANCVRIAIASIDAPTGVLLVALACLSIFAWM